MEKKLIKNASAYVAVNGISQLAVFVLWVIIARFLLPSQIGLYAIFIFIVDFFGSVALFGLQSALTRFYYSKEKLSVFFNALLIILGANALSFTALFFMQNFIGWLMPNISLALKNNLWLFFSLIFFSSLYNLGLSHYAALKKSLWYSVISILQTILFFILSLLFLFWGFGIFGVLRALLISFAFASVVFLLKELKNISADFFSLSVVKSLMSYGFYMMLYSVFGTVTMYAGRIFLDRYDGLSSLGVYSFFLVIALQVNAVFATFNKAWTPEIFSLLEQNKSNALKKISHLAFFFSFAYLIAFLVFIILKSIGFFNLLLQPLYLSNIRIFYFLLFGPLFTGVYTALYPLFYYEKKTRLVFSVSFFANIVDLALTFLMVKMFGDVGAALSFALAIIVSLFLLIFAFRNLTDAPKEVIRLSVGLLLLTSICSVLILKNYTILLILVMLSAALLIFRLGRLRINLTDTLI